MRAPDPFDVLIVLCALAAVIVLAATGLAGVRP